MACCLRWVTIGLLFPGSIAWAEPPGRAIGVRSSSRPVAGDGRRWAFMVGINNYTTQARLKFCRQDCESLKRQLVDRGRFDPGNVVMLTDDAARDQDRPTFGVIYARLPQLLEAAESEDTVVVYLSGHGAQFEDAKGKHACFIPMDGSGRQTSIPLSWVTEQLEACMAASKVLILDCCRNDVTEAGRGGATLDDLAVRDSQGKTFVTIYSCDAGQKSSEHDTSPNGVFTHYMLEGLGGKADRDADGRVDVVEAHQYARRQTMQWGVQHSRPQSPMLKGEIGDPVTLAFVSRPARQDPGRPAPPQPEPARPVSAEQPEETTLDLGNGVKMVCVMIPAGEFLMGSPEEEDERSSDEGPQHLVRISKPFLMGKFEVTNLQYRRYKADHDVPKYGGISISNANQPVVGVSWDNAHGFCEWLSRKTGKTIRLPSEAEWEYAAKCGEGRVFPWGDRWPPVSGSGNYADMALKTKNQFVSETVEEYNDGSCVTSPVGSFAPNRWGLYDMGGNVMEWCEDNYHRSYQGAPVDGKAWCEQHKEEVDYRIARGGCWLSSTRGELRSAKRDGWQATTQGRGIGFRVVVDKK